MHFLCAVLPVNKIVRVTLWQGCFFSEVNCSKKISCNTCTYASLCYTYQTVKLNAVARFFVLYSYFHVIGFVRYKIPSYPPPTLLTSVLSHATWKNRMSANLKTKESIPGLLKTLQIRALTTINGIQHKKRQWKKNVFPSYIINCSYRRIIDHKCK